MNDDFVYKLVDPKHPEDYNNLVGRCIGLEKFSSITRTELDTANNLLLEVHEQIKALKAVPMNLLELSYKIAKHLSPNNPMVVKE